ncbi:MAG: hypothetical protein NVSMB25_09020 [Thermoleophilaceae bacterium]
MVPIHYPHPAALAAAKARAEQALSRLSPRAASPSGGPYASVFSGLNAPGLTAAEGGDFTPPDTTGAIGPSHYVEMVNTAVAVYARGALNRVSGPQTLGTFMQNPTGSSVTDPQIQWDPRWQRWIYLASSFSTASPPALPAEDHILFGWSKTSDPTNLSTGWCRYNIGSGGTAASTDGFLFDDYPKLGHDDNNLVFGTNVFGDKSGVFLTSRVYVVPKPASPELCPGAPTPASYTVNGSPAKPLKTSAGGSAVTPVPANTFDSSAGAYVVAADDPGSGSANHLMAWHVGSGDATAGTPTLVPDGPILVNSYGAPPNVPQPVTGSVCSVLSQSYCLDTLDGRLTMAVALADPGAGREAVWTQQTISDSNGRSAMRWYQLVPSTLSARQQGTITDGTGYVFNGAASPTSGGDAAAFFYNVGGPSQQVDIRARTRSAGLPAGASGGETTIGTSAAPAQDDSCTPGPCRWGDYSGANPDPGNSTLVWGANQLIGSSPAFPGDTTRRWITRIFAVTDSPPPPPPPPSSSPPPTTPPSSSPTAPQPSAAPPGQPLPPVSPPILAPSLNAPSILGLRVTSKRPRRAKRARPQKAVNVVVIDLSRTATLKFTLTGRRDGRLSRGRCRPATRSSRSGRRCTLIVKLNTFSAGGRGGTNTVLLPGGAKLKPGGYDLTAVAIADGLSSAPRSTRFRPAKRR